MDNWVNLLMKQNIEKAINTLGIEKTLETIEGICNPVFRSKLKVAYFDYLKREV